MNLSQNEQQMHRLNGLRIFQCKHTSVQERWIDGEVIHSRLTK